MHPTHSHISTRVGTAELAEAGAELRNLFAPSHPEAFTVEMAASMLENTHRMVALVRPPFRCKGRCGRSHTKDREPRPAAWCPLGCR